MRQRPGWGHGADDAGSGRTAHFNALVCVCAVAPYSLPIAAPHPYNHISGQEQGPAHPGGQAQGTPGAIAQTGVGGRCGGGDTERGSQEGGGAIAQTGVGRRCVGGEVCVGGVTGD